MMLRLISVRIQKEADVVAARRRARQVAGLLGVEPRRQAQFAAAVSEIARNALQHAGQGRVEFGLENDERPRRLVAEVSDSGPGIADLDQVLAGAHPATPSLGLVRARRLVDDFEVVSAPGQGTAVRLALTLPPEGPPSKRDLARLADQLAADAGAPVWSEFQQLNQDLTRALEEVDQLRHEADELNSELEATNRGVVALYAELDEKAEQLKRADELKTRFFSNMSHEFRTPVNSILALSRLLLDRTDGDLSDEQVKQVTFIRQAAQELGELVNDLLDMVKVDAGRVVVRPGRCDVPTLFSTLRAMFRPLATDPAVAFVVEEPPEMPPLFTDEAKLSQILRNFISNALKFTERGEVRVSARLLPERRAVRFAVADTGIGIAPQDQARIFQEFGQLENPIQKRVKGTGLGLALSMRLTELLGGHIGLASELGRGSTFFAEIPLVYGSAGPAAEGLAASARPALPERAAPAEKLLIVDDDPIARYLLRGLLADRACLVLEAPDGATGLRLAHDEQPDAIFLDLAMPGLSGFDVLDHLAAEPETRAIPVIVVTSQVLEDEVRAPLAARVVRILSKEQLGRSDAAEARAAVREALEAARAKP